jgi:TM2 domain-containing membrane protein YozV
MTAPFDNGDDPGQAQPPGYPPPPPSYPPPPPGYYAPPPVYPPPVGQYPGGYGPVAAPYGYHPVTGEPLSDKSKVVAGLLQLLGLLGLLGIGRMYMGQVTFGVLQLVGCLVFAVVTCGIGYVVPVVWGIVDAVVLMTGTPRDQYGRLLRDGG